VKNKKSGAIPSIGVLSALYEARQNEWAGMQSSSGASTDMQFS
jgi:hypothetical protein